VLHSAVHVYLLTLISLYSRYSGLGQIEIDQESKEHTILLNHEFGDEWSFFIKHFIGGVIRAVQASHRNVGRADMKSSSASETPGPGANPLLTPTSTTAKSLSGT